MSRKKIRSSNTWREAAFISIQKKAEDCILNKFANDLKLEGVADNTRWLCHLSEVLPQQKWAEECPEV